MRNIPASTERPDPDLPPPLDAVKGAVFFTVLTASFLFLTFARRRQKCKRNYMYNQTYAKRNTQGLATSAGSAI
jgi:hypothetical protein